MRLRAVALSEWLNQRGHLFPWMPVCLAIGIGGYFALRVEPELVAYACAGLGMLGALALARYSGEASAPVFWTMALILLGFCLAGVRAHSVGYPVLGWRYYGPLEGRIVGIDRSSSNALRLTLDRVALANLRHARTPGQVRVSLHGAQGFVALKPGQTVMMTAHLAPPSGPVEPLGFDFQRHAWFKGIGAVGYTRTPVLLRAPPDGTQRVFALRHAISHRVQTALPGEAGAFAAAIMTGDRSAIGQETLKALRITNLAHLLAISGMHMGLLAGFVFAVLRYGFALIPAIALRLSSKKLAAGCALPFAYAYLLLSGGNVATERAFIMVAVALVAVVLDRRVFSLRAVALAAVIVLVLRPEALLGPGFQMSFAATTALVAAFTCLSDRDVSLGPRWLRPVAMVVISSTVAGLATAPIAAAHFNQFAHYGLVANLLSVPLMGLVVMPAGVVAGLLLPLGLEALPLWVMGQGITWILSVAHWVSALPGARGVVPAPEPAVLPMIALGGLILVLWQGRGRIVGLLPLLAGFLIWANTERPDILISENGALLGIMTVEGRALSRGKGSGFVAQNWLENDGDAADQVGAAKRWALLAPEALPVRALRGKSAFASRVDCGKALVLVATVDPPEGIAPGLGCELLHPARLRRSGAIALYQTETGFRMRTAREVTGTRLWNVQ